MGGSAASRDRPGCANRPFLMSRYPGHASYVLTPSAGDTGELGRGHEERAAEPGRLARRGAAARPLRPRCGGDRGLDALIHRRQGRFQGTERRSGGRQRGRARPRGTVAPGRRAAPGPGPERMFLVRANVSTNHWVGSTRGRPARASLDDGRSVPAGIDGRDERLPVAGCGVESRSVTVCPRGLLEPPDSKVIPAMCVPFRSIGREPGNRPLSSREATENLERDPVSHYARRDDYSGAVATGRVLRPRAPCSLADAVSDRHRQAKRALDAGRGPKRPSAGIRATISPIRLTIRRAGHRQGIQYRSCDGTGSEGERPDRWVTGCRMAGRWPSCGRRSRAGRRRRIGSEPRRRPPASRWAFALCCSSSRGESLPSAHRTTGKSNRERS